MSDGEGDYGPSENCKVQALRPLFVTATEFDTEECCDDLTVAGARYAGSNGPQGLSVDAGAELVWTSDGSEYRSGFKVCAEAGSVWHSMVAA